ncbi:uncharacterized protein LOC124702317 [Lolium rigidum]|uniref:uncharacterized protein LOC124702317 n=1 Tax=Lolium rigidum TaxID=89674 RepID=UPI001F5D7862|nr:uncharacterized protein LOC124702317 [Lolium rigidum]
MAGGPMDVWNEWATQILVLLSLALQIVLHVSAKVRQREASSVLLRLLLWLAYQLADSTATYAVGQLFFSSAPRNHHLVAFWAPFLLLHLGGPDNITAYALEDSKLWKRHFLSLVVQVLGAGYVMYKHIVGSGILLMLAAILMAVIGVAKYGERTWALWCASFSTLQSSLKVMARETHHQHFHAEHQDQYTDFDDVDAELLLQYAHSLFHICKRGIVDSVIDGDSDNPSEVDSATNKIIWNLMDNRARMWTVMEMELSLMYDILYTKASVIHSWFGYCIRVISPLAIVASLVLFQLNRKDGYSQVDVAITYTLLGGALVLETRSLLAALGSSWALAFLCGTRWNWLQHAALCTGRWHRLRRALVSLRRSPPGKMIMPGSSRRWPGTIGQHNMLRFRTGQVDPTSRWLGDISKMLGLREWWDRRCYSWTIIIPEKVKERAQAVQRWVLPGDINTMGLLRHKWGESALHEKRYPGLYERLKTYLGVDFHESIIIWHIATDLILAERKQRGHDSADHRVEVIRTLSNYMMFLLVDRPYMLPGLPQNWLYKQTCKNLDRICKEHLIHPRGNSFCTMLEKLFRPHHHSGLESSELEEKLAEIILKEPQEKKASDSENPRLMYARRIAAELLVYENNELRVLLDLWTDFLAYAANRCSRESHARKLSSGGEFTTVLWLLIEHLCQVKAVAKQRQSRV